MDVQAFATAFIGRLANDAFDAAGSLVAYLGRPDAARSGDEANIVDMRVTAALLDALDYSASERDYNVTKKGGRPDYVIRIKDYPNPCFVVEDKATTEKALEGHRGQLASYMAAVRAGRGLLVNGERLLGYDDAGPASAPTLEIGLLVLVRLWRGEDILASGRTGWEALPPAERDALSILLRRYGRAAFADVSRLIRDLTEDKHGRPHALDGTTWVPGLTREPLNSAKDAPEGLVEAVQGLIAELREDVAVQFAARLRENATYEEEAARAPQSSASAADVMRGIAERILSVLPAREAPRRDGLATRLREAMRGDRPEAEIRAVADEVRAAAGGDLPQMKAAVAEAGAFAARYGRHRLRARDRYAAGVEAVEAYRRWKAAVGTVLLSGASDDRARAEYFVQTAYLVVVRMLLVRVLEDKGLTRRIFTNGGAALWFREVEPHYFSLSRGRSPLGWHAPPEAPGAALRPFTVAKARWGFTVEHAPSKADALRREGDVLLSGKRPALRFGAGTPIGAMDYLLRLLRAEGPTTLGAVESGARPVPLDPGEAASAEAALLRAERATLAREDAILARRAEIDALLAPLFETVPHPPIEAIGPI